MTRRWLIRIGMLGLLNFAGHVHGQDTSPAPAPVPSPTVPFKGATSLHSLPAGQVRVLIGDQYALDDLALTEYNKCLSAVKLDQDIQAVVRARELCKTQAQLNAFKLPVNDGKADGRAFEGLGSVKERSAWQLETLPAVNVQNRSKLPN